MKALFIAVAGPREGLGHLLRCRVLMLEMVRMGWSLELLFLGPNAILAKWDWPQKVTLTCLGETLENEAIHALLAQKLVDGGVSWVIIDGYRFRGASWHELVSKQQARLLMLDDIGDQVFSADAVLNPNGADRDFYVARGICAKLWLLGSQFALVERDYIAPKNKKTNPELNRVLVVFGGADRRQMTPKSVTALRAIKPTLHLEIVLGPYSAWIDPPRNQPGLVFHRAPQGLAPLMHQADLIVTAAGSTVWQACAAECPSIVVQTVDNQALVVATLRQSQAALFADAEMLNAELPRAIEALRSVKVRKELVDRARNLVDGLGAARVVEALSV